MTDLDSNHPSPPSQQPSQPSPPSQQSSDDDDKDSKSRLLILDMNGLLCRKIFENNYDEDNPASDQYEKVDLEQFHVFIRPDIKAFLEKCFELADVAFWSSTTYYNAKHIIDHILTKSQQDDAVFKWYRDRTKLDPSYGTDSDTKESDTIKDLNDVWSSPVVNRYRVYDSSNTIICDDDPRKIRFNNKENVIVVPTFDPWESEYDNTVMEDLLEKIERLFQ